METGQSTNAANRYCQRLGMSVPDLEVALANADLKLVHLMGLALLEAGGPLSLEAIADRLGRLALPPRLAVADLPASLRKAWHGQPPIVRDPREGLFYLDLLFHDDLRHLARLANPVRGRPARLIAEAVQQPPDDVPLSQAEVDAAFRDRAIDTYSSIRRALAILEASGTATLSLDEVNGRLIALAGERARINEPSVAAWRSEVVTIGPGGMLHLQAASPELPRVRRDIRRMASARLRQQVERDEVLAWRAAYETARDAEERRDVEEARRVRRGLVHGVVVNDILRAAVVIDARTSQQRILVGEELHELPAHLERFDFLAGLDLRLLLRLLGTDPDRWWLAELRPPSRTFRPRDFGSALPVSMPAILHATTGTRHAPADTDTWRKLLSGPSTRIAHRIEGEAQALLALYRYGALHRGVRMRRGQGERLLPVAWSLPGDPDLGSFVDAAIRRWVPAQIVVGASSDLADPWAAAVTVTIVERDGPVLVVRQGEDVRVLDPADIRAIRLPDAAAAATVRPAFHYRHDSRTCQLTATLEQIEPPIWRRLEVPAFLTLAGLHEVLQAAFGWTNSHLHVFEIGDERMAIPYDLEQFTEGQITRSARLVTLGHVVDHGFRHFTYEYDFGDSWRHAVTIQEVREASDGAGGVRCLDGARSCPPEDCGGPTGYARLLEILFDPRHPEFDEMRNWVGRGFEPDRFDLRAVNAGLSAIRWQA